MYKKINGLDIHYETHGSGPAIILLHGFGGNLTYWEPQVRALSHQFTVIAYDQRGCGKSEQPKSGYATADFVEELAGLIRALEVAPAYLLGFSQGGAISLLTATLYPEFIKGLVLSNSTTEFAAPVTPEKRKMAAGMIALIEQGGITPYADSFMQMAFSPGFKERNPEAWNRYYQVLLDGKPETLVGIIRAGLDQAPPVLNLDNVTCPILFIHGEHDPMATPERRTKAHESLPGSKMILLPVGHTSAAEAPEEFNRIVLDFLVECESNVR